MAQPTLHRLDEISPRAFQHPADRAATAALAQIPGVDRAVRKLTEFRYERALRQVFLANAVKVGPRQLPEIWTVYERAADTLDVQPLPDLYVTQFPLTNAAAIGADKPIILLTSQLADTLEPDELWSVLGHELGHVLSGHVLYQTALLTLLQLGGSLPLVGRLPFRAVQAVLLEWSRAAELSADRAGALACRDPIVSCRGLMVMAAGLPSRRLDLDAFLQQAAEYEEWDSRWDRLLRFFAARQTTHPYAVRRVKELTEWIHSGEYDRILGGHYARRGDARFQEDADAASEYYTTRLWNIYREVSDEARGLRDRIDGWLSREQDDESETSEPG